MEYAEVDTTRLGRLLVALALCLAESGVSWAQGMAAETALRFPDAGSLTKWMSSRYSEHSVEEHLFGQIKLYPAYGSYGSGIIRVDSFFYTCEESGCRLLGMKAGTLAREMRGPAKITYRDSKLTIESPNNYRIQHTFSP